MNRFNVIILLGAWFLTGSVGATGKKAPAKKGCFEIFNIVLSSNEGVSLTNAEYQAHLETILGRQRIFFKGKLRELILPEPQLGIAVSPDLLPKARKNIDARIKQLNQAVDDAIKKGRSVAQLSTALARMVALSKFLEKIEEAVELADSGTEGPFGIKPVEKNGPRSYLLDIAEIQVELKAETNFPNDPVRTVDVVEEIMKGKLDPFQTIKYLGAVAPSAVDIKN